MESIQWVGVVEGCVLTLVEAWVGVASPMAWAVALEVEVSLKKKVNNIIKV